MHSDKFYKLREKAEQLVRASNDNRSETTDTSVIRDILESIDEIETRMAEIKARNRELSGIQELLNGIINTAPAIILLLDRDGNIRFINPYMEKISGYALSDVIGKDWFDTFLPDRSREATRTLFGKAIGDEPTHGNIDTIVTRNGEEHLIEWYDTTVKDDEGNTDGLLSIGQDVTDREAAIGKLQKSEINLSYALEMAGAGHWEYDVEKDVFTFNDGFYRIFRTTAEEAGGYLMSSAEYASRFCHPEDAPLVGREIRAAIETGDPGYSSQIDHRIIYADGEIGNISVRFRILKDSTGKTVKTYGVNQDITARKRAEEEYKALQASLIQSDRLSSMGVLAAGVAHEINSPLSYVLYNIESIGQDMPKLVELMRRCYAALSEQTGPEAVAKAIGDDQRIFDPAGFDDVIERLDDALTGTRRIKGIVRSLGTFSRVERSTLMTVDIQDCVENAATMILNELKYRARFVKDFQPVPQVLASEGKMAQVFLNLLLNAAHAIEEGNVDQNEVRVSTRSNDDSVFIEVSDTGKGIAPQHQAKIFRPFFTTKKKGLGTGLGLSICKRIIEDSGGTISFTSEVKKGTKFKIRLPRMPSGWAENNEMETDQTPVEASIRGRILVVDDEAGIRSSIARLLKKDHEIVTVSSGIEGRSLLKKDKGFDLILCDLMMPEMSGMELHEWLTGYDEELAQRVVFITGGAFTTGASEYLAKVGNTWVEKPFDTIAFRKMTNEMVAANLAGSKTSI